ncbi:MAG: hypothetical protein KZQ81_06060 [Candidatus Thiodiazotropha sp. (ex Rostrolucina anterorostrata)]|nr:hypothetical protein [Candidatus Thiodiazotropha sp. (ex Rostrolucina anterorostrata)]
MLLMIWVNDVFSAPESGRIYRLLVLDSQLGSPYEEVCESMLERLKKYDYEEGKNLHVSFYSAGNDAAKGEAILRSEAHNGHDVVYVGGTTATVAAKHVFLGADQPVVFASPMDPVGIGVIDGFDTPPKSNFTGVCFPVPVKSRFRFIRQLMPDARRFGLIYADMPQLHSYNAWIKEMLAKDPQFKDIEVIFRKVPFAKGEEGDTRMAEIALPIIHELDAQVDLFIKPNDQLGTRRIFAEQIYAHASKPLIGIVKSDVMEDWGAMAVVFPSHSSMGQQAAAMIHEIFEGKSVSRILPQWPARYGYAVDLQKTRRFGVEVPVGLLQLAGENIRK